ncbi:MAG: tRNA pseudouridine(38-40) synthase TruA [Bacteroidales bacterium]|nr:tRNA pseudouridine(38-40) synthase TruA [Bacteroidales bacterium]
MAYDGTDFHGWQVQPNAASVQQTLNEALCKVLRRDVYCVGAGRTDTGVHADYFVAHFEVSEEIADCDKVVFKLNAVLPESIAVFSIQHTDDELHSRFSALSRMYYYRLSFRKNPFSRWNRYRPYFEPDFELMNEAAKLLLTTTDFTSFSKLHTDTKTNECIVSRAVWVQESDTEWRFEIKANRFLRNMVRAVVGTLFDVGRHKIDIERFKAIIDSHDRCEASTSAPACGLSLVDIEYPTGLGFERTVKIER